MKPKKSQPQPRTLEAITSEYASVCARLGEIVYRRRAMEQEAEELHARLGALNLEADQVKKSNPQPQEK
jgi:hypothetical protein